MTEDMRAKRQAFLEGRLLDGATGRPVGVLSEPGRVVEGEIDGQSGFLILASASRRAFHVHSTVRDALYGDVALANEAVQRPDGTYQKVDRVFAVKRLYLVRPRGARRGAAC